jgi:hypothetical protein
MAGIDASVFRFGPAILRIAIHAWRTTRFSERRDFC